MLKPKMKILNKNKILLPFLNRSKFLLLMKLGLGYEHGTFYIKDFNRVEEIKDALSEILNKEIIFPQLCLICGREYLCTDCRYYEVCPSRNLPFHCICKICSEKHDLYYQYITITQQS